ncbi:MAG: hypothetical protein CVT94_06840 [Bacteroidetes bacterium HGW-Bacteroidetes-11]|jgi:uncharacterized protein YebE (UPF0316 family)|nr:MAG: hypothetical protein CVT94_06840 [Bacteroidetes bacterium HGW-Bacteroidetes-11]
MDLSLIFDTDSAIFAWVILPLLIFLARISDQTIGTLRLIFLSKGQKFLAPFLGFFEVIIWLIAVSQIMKHLDNVLAYIAYGGGFAMGNYIGMVIEEKLSIGNVLIRIIPKKDTSDLIAYLRESNYGVTSVRAEGSKGEVDIVFTIIKRKDIEHVVAIINKFNPNAFYTIEDVKAINEGIFKHTRKATIFDNFSYHLKKNK